MKKSITAEEFDRKFDNGEDVSEYIDWSTAKRLNKETQRVNVDFPAWVVQALDAEAARFGISRQAFIKVAIVERLENSGRAQ